MALTEEQIKNLKPGDTLILNNYPISYLGTYTSGIIGALDDKAEACCYTRCHFPQQYLSLPPKHDPCRMFKKGDIVRLKEWNGRCPEMYSGTNSWFNHPPRCKNGNLEVREDEKNSRVEIGIIGVDCAHAAAAPCFLELVTPVEERMPYSIDPANTNVLFKCGKKLATFEDDDEARDMCDRLNAEYRKEQK